MARQTRVFSWASMLLLLLALGLFAGAGSAQAEDESDAVTSNSDLGPFGVKQPRVETSVGEIKPYTPDTQEQTTDGVRTALSTQCHQQDVTMTYADSKGPYIKFTGTKKWCYDGYKVTSGSMDVKPWIRSDSRYGPGQDGFVYVPEGLKKSDQFLTYNGRSNGAHESVRVGRFEWRVHGFPRAAQVFLPYISRTGKYTGECDGPKPRDASPKVTTVKPARDTKNVSPTANVEANFTAAMKSSTLDDNTFSLIKRGTFDPVKAAYRYDTERKQAILDPSNKLAPGIYTATVSAGPFGVLTTDGDPIVNTKSWSFTVG